MKLKKNIKSTTKYNKNFCDKKHKPEFAYIKATKFYWQIKDYFTKSNVIQIFFIFKMNKHCFVVPSNLTLAFVNKPLINLVVGVYKSDVINTII